MNFAPQMVWVVDYGKLRKPMFCGSPSGNARSVLFPPLLHPALRAEVHLTKLPMALAMALCTLHYPCESPPFGCSNSSFTVLTEHTGTAQILKKWVLAWVCVLSHILRPLLTSRYHQSDPIESPHGKWGAAVRVKARETLAKSGKMLSSWLRVSQNRKSQMMRYRRSPTPRAPSPRHHASPTWRQSGDELLYPLLHPAVRP